MDLGFFKRHPVMTAGVVVIGGIVFFSIFNAGGSGGTTQTAAGISAADQQYRLAQLSANVQGQALDTQLEGLKIQTAAAIEAKSFEFDLEALKAGIAQTLGLASIDAQNRMTANDLEMYKIGTAASLENSRLQYTLQDTIAARSQALAQSQISSDNDKAAWAYTLQYQNNANNANIQQQLLDVIKNQQAA